MPQHLVAYQQSIDAATLTAINTVNDDVLTRQGATRFVVPTDYNNIRWAVALGANLSRAHVEAPSLEVRRVRADIIPHVRGGSALSATGPEIWKPPVPVALTPSEEMEVNVTEDAAGASQVDVLVSLGMADLPAAPDGDRRRVRATGTTTLVARAWTTVPLTLEMSLEAGLYALVGFLPISAGVIGARALITGQVFRPGKPGRAAAEVTARDFDGSSWYFEPEYDMGEFDHLNFPQFQFYSVSADVAETVIADVVKIG